MDSFSFALRETQGFRRDGDFLMPCALIRSFERADMLDTKIGAGRRIIPRDAPKSASRRG